jgi:hypothetical protein
MHDLQREDPVTSGASQVKQHIENPICSMALRGIDM